MNDNELVPIKGFEGLYSVNRKGQVFSYKTRTFLKPNLNSSGYLRFYLHKEKSNEQLFIHRILAQTFISNPRNKSEVNHKDGNSLNNDISNLEWVTAKENRRHAMLVLKTFSPPPHFKGESCSWSKLTEKQVIDIRNKYKQGFTETKIASLYNVHVSSISLIITRKHWSHVQ